MYKSLRRQYIILNGLSYTKMLASLVVAVFSFSLEGVLQYIVWVAVLLLLMSGWQLKKVSDSVHDTYLSILRGEMEVMLHRSKVLGEVLPCEVLEGLPVSLLMYRTFEDNKLKAVINGLSGQELEKGVVYLRRFYVREAGVNKPKAEIKV